MKIFAMDSLIYISLLQLKCSKYNPQKELRPYLHVPSVPSQFLFNQRLTKSYDVGQTVYIGVGDIMFNITLSVICLKKRFINIQFRERFGT